MEEGNVCEYVKFMVNVPVYDIYMFVHVKSICHTGNTNFLIYKETAWCVYVSAVLCV